MEGFIEYIDSNYTLKAVGDGTNMQLMNGICPFCGQSKHDLRIYYNINKDQGICHHCGQGFNAVSFFSKREGVSVQQAKQQLSGDDFYKRTQMSQNVTQDHCPFPPNAVSASVDDAYKYLESRNVLRQTISEFDIKYCYDNFTWGEMTVFVAGRIIFPIYDENGLVSWQGRDSTGYASQKYYFPKGFKAGECLYNYQNVGSNNYLIICEGIMDVIGWWQAGFYNVVATFGKKISAYQMDMILKKKPKVVYIAWDSDAEVKKYEFAKKYQHLFQTKLIDLNGKDADELSKSSLINYFNCASNYSWRDSILTLLR